MDTERQLLFGLGKTRGGQVVHLVPEEGLALNEHGLCGRETTWIWRANIELEQVADLVAAGERICAVCERLARGDSTAVPRVIVEIEQGVVQSVYADAPVQVFVADYDAVEMQAERLDEELRPDHLVARHDIGASPEAGAAFDEAVVRVRFVAGYDIDGDA